MNSIAGPLPSTTSSGMLNPIGSTTHVLRGDILERLRGPREGRQGHAELLQSVAHPNLDPAILSAAFWSFIGRYWQICAKIPDIL